jgi:hypothetical protein
LDIAVPVPFGKAAAVFAVAGAVELPGVAGALCAERFACGGKIGGFGEKNRVHNKVTPIESKDAANKRIS